MRQGGRKRGRGDRGDIGKKGGRQIQVKRAVAKRSSFQATEGWFYYDETSRLAAGSFFLSRYVGNVSQTTEEGYSKVTYLWSPSSLNSAYLGDGCLLELSLTVLITYMNTTLITFPKCLYFMRP